ncbi:ATP-binding cassette domain-containing protein, partial [Candidatus Desantisbacteria bacterium]|nr:ATP-binding cassette domain-containing protein [Candidatus Desantisbacteria bacterium]
MIIQADNINFIYKNNNTYITALNNISFNIKKGEFTAIIGANGSGKTSLGKLFNALLLPSTGKMIINGMDTSLPVNLQKKKIKVGM